MDPRRLLLNEVSYELRIRGKSNSGTAKQRKQRLRECFHKDPCVSLVEPMLEVNACQVKLALFQQLIANQVEDPGESSQRRLQALTCHLRGRIYRLRTVPFWHRSALNLLHRWPR